MPKVRGRVSIDISRHELRRLREYVQAASLIAGTDEVVALAEGVWESPEGPIFLGGHHAPIVRFGRRWVWLDLGEEGTARAEPGPESEATLEIRERR